mgnify:CR=1 FL=1
MFNILRKKYEYGLLQNREDGFVFMKKSTDNEEGLEGNFLEVFNKLGNKGWELVEDDSQIGFIFKR